MHTLWVWAGIAPGQLDKRVLQSVDSCCWFAVCGCASGFRGYTHRWCASLLDMVVGDMVSLPFRIRQTLLCTSCVHGGTLSHWPGRRSPCFLFRSRVDAFVHKPAQVTCRCNLVAPNAILLRPGSYIVFQLRVFESLECLRRPIVTRAHTPRQVVEAEIKTIKT